MDGYVHRKFKINWRVKTSAFRFFDAVAFGEQMYAFTQRNITRSYPRPMTPTDQTAKRFIQHVETFRRHLNGKFPDVRLFEFGAGWDLYSNMVMWCYGVDAQLVFDLRRWVKPRLINSVIRHLMADPPPQAQRAPSLLLRERRDFDRELREVYGIEYHAPADASDTGFAAGSVDIVLTTSVLEHVPEPQLNRLLAECRRLMHPCSVMSHVIDYSDHYAHSDLKIGPYNFLQFTENEWKRYNPDIHYQNRLRHVDYRRLFTEAGLVVVEEVSEQPRDVGSLLGSISLADQFERYDLDEIAPLVGHYVLQVG